MVPYSVADNAAIIESTDGEARILQGIISGIGFIGGGANLNDQDQVAGVALAASISKAGAIDAAVAFDRFEIAIMLSALNVVTMLFFRPRQQKSSV